MRWLALVGGALWAGCAHVPECAAHGGRVWTELRSPHFVVRTDAEADVARRAVLDLARAHSALQGYFTSAPSRPLDVVLFRDHLELNALVKASLLTGIDGAYTSGAQGELLLLTGEGFFVDDHVSRRLVLHELTHWFSAWTNRTQPWWLSEGFASYLETTQLDERLNTALFGSVTRERSMLLGRWGAVPLEELWSWEGKAGPNTVAHRYASAWFWVHFFLNVENAAFQRFLSELENGAAPREAFARQFSYLSPATLSERGRDYARDGTFETRFVVTPPPSTRVDSTLMSPASVHATLARVAGLSANRDEAIRHMELGIALDATNLEVLEQIAWTTKRSQPSFAKLVEAMLVAHPDDARTWFFASKLREDPDPSLERAVTLDPTYAPALIELALVRDELELAERAVAAAPWNARALWVLGTVLARRGQCERSALLYRRAASAGSVVKDEVSCVPGERR